MMPNSMRARQLVQLLLLAGAAAACSRDRTGAGGSAPPGGLPPLTQSERARLGAAGAPEQPAAALPPGHPEVPAPGETGELPSGHPEVPAPGETGELPPGHPAVGQAPTAPIDRNQLISGIIRVSPKVKDKIHAGEALFVAVRQDQGGLPGQILAVDRLQVGDFPMPFALDGSKAMVAGTAFTGKVIVTVRADSDGDAMTKSPGDVQGVVNADIPARHVVVTLDTVLP
jgi:hypothetical protein